MQLSSNDKLPGGEYYHLYSNGKKTPHFLISDKDKIFAMNLIPRCALTADITVLAFTLLDTHFHFILKGTEENCTIFSNEFRNKLVSVLSKRKEYPLLSTEIEISLACIDTRTDLMSKICYVIRNSLSVESNYLPSEYRWSSSDLYFTKSERFRNHGKELRTIPINLQRIILRTKYKYPQDWRISDDGMILPENYVDYKHVCNIFVTPKCYIAFMHIKKDDEVRLKLEMMKSDIEKLSDSELKNNAVKMSEELFGKSIENMKMAERVFLSSKLMRKYNTSAKQLARVMDLDVELIKEILE